MAEETKQIDGAVKQEPIMSITGEDIPTEIKSDKIFTTDEDIFFLKSKIKQLENSISSTGKYLVGIGSKNSNGDVTIATTFKPKLIRITSHFAQDGAGFAIGTATSTTDESTFIFHNDGSNFIAEFINTYIIYALNASGTLMIRANVKSITSTGVTFTFSSYDSGTIYYKYEFYS